jgi:guanylate kinase
MSSEPAVARGMLLVVSSPSGAGKTTLCNRLRAEFDTLNFSVSYTTRKPRAGETNGIEYHFVDQPTFQEMIARDEFAEYAMVHGHMYGTSAALVRDALENGRDLLFDIDYQGGRQLRQWSSSPRPFGADGPGDVVSVFILPPSIKALATRLQSRATDSEEVIARRLRVAREELKHYAEYDYLIMNDDLERAYDALRSVYVAHLHACHRRAAEADAVIGGQESLF